MRLTSNGFNGARMHPYGRAISACLFVLCVLFYGLEARAEVKSVMPDPGLSNPKLRFHTGGAAHNAPEISPILPRISGEASAWYVAQWNKHQFLRPNEMVRNDRRYTDPRLGTPLYTFVTPDQESRVSIFSTASGKNVFELAEAGGSLTGAGGSNVFLAAYARPNATFDRPIDYSVDMKFSAADVAAPVAALQNGIVFAQAISGFTLLFADAKTGAKMSVFMQINHGNTRQNSSDYRGCFSDQGNRNVLFGYVGSKVYRMPVRRNNGPPLHIDYGLNQILCDLLNTRFSCADAHGGGLSALIFPPAAHDLKNWSLTSMYVGLETQDRDERPSAVTHGQQGTVKVAVQISNLRVVSDTSRHFACPITSGARQ